MRIVVVPRALAQRLHPYQNPTVDMQKPVIEDEADAAHAKYTKGKRKNYKSPLRRAIRRRAPLTTTRHERMRLFLEGLRCRAQI